MVRNHIYSPGRLVDGSKEDETEGGWGFDPIFIPMKSDLTFGQLGTLKRKQDFSHRSKALSKFAEWYTQLNRHDEN